MKYESKYTVLFKEICILKRGLQNDDHFVSALICYRENSYDGVTTDHSLCMIYIHICLYIYIIVSCNIVYMESLVPEAGTYSTDAQLHPTVYCDM